MDAELSCKNDDVDDDDKILSDLDFLLLLPLSCFLIMDGFELLLCNDLQDSVFSALTFLFDLSFGIH